MDLATVKLGVDGGIARVVLNRPAQLNAISPSLLQDLDPAATLLGLIAPRIEANDLSGARRWLDWARLELRPANTEDPLEGPAFARAWTVGVETDLARSRLATALLLADCAMGERALPLLSSVDKNALSATDRLSLDLALGKVTLPNLPFRFSDCDTTVRAPAPLLGQDNRRIAASLGLSAELVEAMVRDGVLYNEAAVQE